MALSSQQKYIQSSVRNSGQKRDGLKHPRGFTVLELLLAGAAIFAVVAVFQVLLLHVNAQQRDLHRLADMREAEVAWQKLFRLSGSYVPATESGCNELGAMLASCNFSRIGVSLRQLADPGKHAYVVSSLPTDTSFAVTFQLERAHGAIAAGEHVLTEKGIQ